MSACAPILLAVLLASCEGGDATGVRSDPAEVQDVGAVRAAPSDPTLAAVEIETDSLVPAVRGEPYRSVLRARGGVPQRLRDPVVHDAPTPSEAGAGAYQWRVAYGEVPPGLHLGARTGALEGTPTAQGLFDFTVEASSGSQHALRRFVLAVAPARLVLGPGYLDGGNRGTPYTASLVAEGGVGGYLFYVASGELPPGLSLDPESGVLSGVPTRAGLFSFTLEVASGRAASGHTFLMSVADRGPEGYDIWAVGADGTPVPDRVREALATAVARWEEIVTGDVPGFSVPAGFFGPEHCGGFGTMVNGRRGDDLLLLVQVGPIDGRRGILARAGPCALNGSQAPYRTSVGLVTLDEADLDGLSPLQLEASLTHEIGHVLGIGTLWQCCGNVLVRDGAGTDPRYLGQGGIAEYALLTGAPKLDVPAADRGGSATRGQHWRESVFGPELMTGYAEGPTTTQPLSVLTIGAVADLGYVVDYGRADPFTLDGARGVEGRRESDSTTSAWDALLNEPVRILRPAGGGDAGGARR